jgi:hypothetical protein
LVLHLKEDPGWKTPSFLPLAFSFPQIFGTNILWQR